MTPLSKPPRAIFFDWDATLVNTIDTIEAAHNHVLSLLNLPSRPKGWLKPIFGMTREESYATIYSEHAKTVYDTIDTAFRAHIKENHLNGLNPMPYAESLLTYLGQQDNLTLGIVTNKRRILAEAELKYLGWDHMIQTLVGAGDAAADKPSAAPLFLALEHSGYRGDIKDVWFIGDSRADQMCAKNAGCSFIAYADGDMPPLDERLYPPLFTARDHSFILQFLQKFDTFV